MSYCKNFGKDRVIFITKEDHEKPSTIQLPDDPEDEKRGMGAAADNLDCSGPHMSIHCRTHSPSAFHSVPLGLALQRQRN
ncbi:mitochondrial intermembrane space import and assembly protein 40-like isoform X2 [Dermacentor silvarum]|uniref:mitochondrial intermembrane space import and assembly protein 40-like isoform X2 n=1 Tax=Dermacentor silvarum TaxID=543639 RepID=UPI002101A06F|nr:mitochondrial intermembrane space import and assembly protein 40-like isoform X2 [Dermacentor silvarum]